MTILYIILSLGAIYVLMLIVMLAVLIFRLATGRMTREQLNANVEANRRAETRTQAQKTPHQDYGLGTFYGLTLASQPLGAVELNICEMGRVEWQKF